MHIEEKDSLEVYYYLQYERERGMEWILYNEEKNGVTAAGIFCFAGREEMEGFRQQYPAFAGGFKEANLELVVESMATILEPDEGLRAKAVDIKVHAENKKPNGLLPKKHHDNKHRQGLRVK